MKKNYVIYTIIVAAVLCSFSFKKPHNNRLYKSYFSQKVNDFSDLQHRLLQLINKTDITAELGKERIKEQINLTRLSLKGIDFWLRYAEPIAYKKINGPLPVEWETEVFEKFEKPYKRDGAGLTIAALYLGEKEVDKDSLLMLIQQSVLATETYMADSIISQLENHHQFFLSNRLFLLNLAAIYTTGFECPDTTRIIPELSSMIAEVKGIYNAFNESFPDKSLSQQYLSVYDKMMDFVKGQSTSYSAFNHFLFIKEFVNPLFTINQQFISDYGVFTSSYVDYSLNNLSRSIFDKDLYFGQNTKGVFLRVTDKKALDEIERIGKLLFYDPLLSANNRRSCNSCHNGDTYFTDTLSGTSLQFNERDHLPRNTPSLINASYNHLLMMDGKHFSLQNQTKDVITNAVEMGSNEKELLEKILGCKEYEKAFKSFLKYTPAEKEITIEHIASAITLYYGKFSKYSASFDDMMNNKTNTVAEIQDGFNVFMSKAKCGTCHFVPQFNGVKPPYIGSEFEVLGVPADTGFTRLSADKGRYTFNPAPEMLNAFRTGSLRNSAKTHPYMHNGVFTSLEQVVDFYDAGGGAGKGLQINNQTLPPDSLKLTGSEKKNLILFIRSLNENITFDAAPEKLPVSKDKLLNRRKIGGEY